MDLIEQLRQRTLVLKCQLGDRPALQELFLRHNRPLGYYLRRMLGRDDVEDVRQDVWLAVIRRIGGLRSADAFVVWLYQIARRKALKRLTQPSPALSLEAAEALDASRLPDEPEFSESDAAAIHEGLSRLRPEHREVLVLRFIEDLSYEQIAEVAGCNPGTVRSRLHYAKLALRQKLETHR